jgi:hypothetical protein
MPRKVQAKATGVWEKIPGSGVWWIRYRVDGRLKREKVGRKGDAIDLYQKRKADIRAGVKLPDNMKSAGVKFKSLADAILTYSKAQQLEGLDDGQVPPKLSALAEDHANLRNVLDTLPPGHTSAHFAPAGVRYQDSGERLDRGALACAVGSDISDQFARVDRKADPVESPQLTVPPMNQSAHTAP